MFIFYYHYDYYYDDYDYDYDYDNDYYCYLLYYIILYFVGVQCAAYGAKCSSYNIGEVLYHRVMKVVRMSQRSGGLRKSLTPNVDPNSSLNPKP